jgi:hypothetical protein
MSSVVLTVWGRHLFDARQRRIDSKQFWLEALHWASWEAANRVVLSRHQQSLPRFGDSLAQPPYCTVQGTVSLADMRLCHNVYLLGLYCWTQYHRGRSLEKQSGLPQRSVRSRQETRCHRSLLLHAPSHTKSQYRLGLKPRQDFETPVDRFTRRATPLY